MRLHGKRCFMCAGCSDLKISGEASGDERCAALAVRDVKRMVAEGRERVPVVQVGIKHEIVFAAGEVRADLCVVQAGNGGERLDGRRKARFGFTALRPRGTPPEASRTKCVVSWVNSFFFDRI